MSGGGSSPGQYKGLLPPLHASGRLNMRAILAATALSGLLILYLCTSDSSLAASFRSMASSPPQEVRDPHILQSQISLELSQPDPQSSPSKIMVTVKNMHESTTITLLKWDTPFDDQAMLLGIFQIKNTADGSILPPAGIKVNRKLPPPEDAFLEIPPKTAVAQEVVISGVGARALKKGRKYEITAKGRWKAIWQASVTDVGYSNLQKMGGGTGVSTFEFESNAITVEA